MKINLFPWRHFVAALLLLALPFVVQAQFTYVTNSDGSSITITGYNGPGGAAVIPELIGNHFVADIANGAFAYNTNITSITISNSYYFYHLSIGASAFMGCSGLTNIFLGNTVTNIEDFAFAYCTNLTSVYFGNNGSQERGDINIGADTFTSCTSLVNVYIAGTITNIGDSAFAYCSSLANISIPTNVASVGEYAFYDDGLTSIIIANGVTNIGYYAFGDCTNLTSAYFEGNSPPDDGTAFYDDPGAVVYYLPGTTNWGSTFGNAPTAENQTPAPDFSYVLHDGSIYISGYHGPGGTVVIPPFINGYPVTGIGSEEPFGVFPDDVTNVIIPNTVTNIAQGAFQMSSLISLTIPNSVISIGADAFTESESLTSITIPDGVTSIGESAFGDCGRLTRITISSSVANIGTEAFGGTPSLTNISVAPANPDYSSLNGVLFEFDQPPYTLIVYPQGLSNPYIIPNGVTQIEQEAFGSCTGLTSVTIPNNVTSIGGYAFYDDGLTNVTILGNVISIGQSAFADCKNLTSMTFGNGVTSIGAWGGTFQNCASLTNISIDAANPVYSSLNGVLFDKAQNALIAYPSGLSGPYAIPASVTSIGVSAFQNCTSLTSVSIPGGVANIGAAAFYDCYNLTNLTITNGITSIGTWAFGYCSLVSAVIPASVTNFGSGALQECTNLTSAYFEGNAPPDLGNAFFGDPTTVYYLPGTTGWTNTYGGAPTALWLPTLSSFEPSFGVQNHQFSFLVSWAPNTSVIVQACTNLANPNWIPVATNFLSNGTNYFGDPQWTNYPSRFYRVSGP